MSINDNEQAVIAEFFQIFATASMNSIKKILDSNLYKNATMQVVQCIEIENREELKKNNIFYKHSYAIGINENKFGMLMPEEMICQFADILMGGKGDKKYSGVLTELEINSASSMLPKVFIAAEDKFKQIHDHSITFSASPKLLVKENDDYHQAFENLELDFAVYLNLKIDSDNVFEIVHLTNLSNLLEILKDLDLIKPKIFKPYDTEKINIENITDLKIDITAELGRTRLPLSSALALINGSYIKIDTLNGDDISVYANDVEVAKAQIVVIKESFGLRITKIISPEERVKYI